MGEVSQAPEALEPGGVAQGQLDVRGRSTQFSQDSRHGPSVCSRLNSTGADDE